MQFRVYPRASVPIAIIAASFLIRNTRQEHRFLDRIPGKLGCNERNKTPIDFLYRLPILSARAICTSIDSRIVRLFLRSDIEGRNVNLNSDSFFFLLLLRIASNLITFRSSNENVSSQISINTRFNLNSIFTKERNVLFDITVLFIYLYILIFDISFLRMDRIKIQPDAISKILPRPLGETRVLFPLGSS